MVADLADERFDRQVDLGVFQQVAGCFEPFLTESASEGSLLGVTSMMSAQLVLAAKPLLTLTTRQPGR